MIQGLGQTNTINNYNSAGKTTKTDMPADTEKVNIGGSQADSEMQKADELREMHRSSLMDNLKEVVVGLTDGTSKVGTVCGVLAAAGAGAAAVALGAGALVAVGAGAVGFVVGGYAGVVIDFIRHPSLF